MIILNERLLEIADYCQIQKKNSGPAELETVEGNLRGMANSLRLKNHLDHLLS